MIQIKRFGKIAMALGLHKKFLSEHPPLGGKQNSVFFNPSGTYVLYEDEQGVTKAEILATLMDSLRADKMSILACEMTYRNYITKVPMLESEIASLEARIATYQKKEIGSKEGYDKKKELEDQKASKQQELQASNNQILLANFEKDRLYHQISATEGLLKDIQQGNFTI